MHKVQKMLTVQNYRRDDNVLNQYIVKIDGVEMVVHVPQGRALKDALCTLFGVHDISFAPNEN